jgi:hypothetical protein
MRRSFKDARMLMTAAMAFFSIALTLNLIGIRVDSLRMADLKPAALQNTIARQFYGAKKQMVSYYENLRLVYEVETKMQELRRDADTQPNTQPKKDQKPQGDVHKNGGRLQTPKSAAPAAVVMWGEPVLASLHDHGAQREEKSVEVSDLAAKNEADQAERSLA